MTFYFWETSTGNSLLAKESSLQEESLQKHLLWYYARFLLVLEAVLDKERGRTWAIAIRRGWYKSRGPIFSERGHFSSDLCRLISSKSRWPKTIPLQLRRGHGSVKKMSIKSGILPPSIRIKRGVLKT